MEAPGPHSHHAHARPLLEMEDMFKVESQRRNSAEPGAMEADPKDSYGHYIELSNACRRVYVDCIRKAEVIRKATRNEELPLRQDSIDARLYELRLSIADLIESDVSLMREMLSLNETIEELKWRRRLNDLHLPGSVDSVPSNHMCSADFLRPHEPSYLFHGRVRGRVFKSSDLLSCIPTVSECRPVIANSHSPDDRPLLAVEHPSTETSPMARNDPRIQVEGKRMSSNSEDHSVDSGIHEPDSELLEHSLS